MSTKPLLNPRGIKPLTRKKAHNYQNVRAYMYKDTIIPRRITYANISCNIKHSLMNTLVF